MPSFARYATAGLVIAGFACQLPGCVRVGTGSGAFTGEPTPVRASSTEPTQVDETVDTQTVQSRPVEPQPEETPEELDWVERGTASWYGEAHHGKTTASGEAFDMYAMTAAHPKLEMGTRVEVENLANGRTVIVRINDRGPFTQDRVIDLSMAAAQALGFAAAGTAEVEIRPLR